VLVIDGDDCGLQQTVAGWPFVDRVDTDATTEENAFDAVVACRSLHGLSLETIDRAMKPEAALVVNDAVALPLGDDLLEMENALRAAIGATPVEEPPATASGALQSLFARFEVIEEKKLGGTLLRHLLDVPLARPVVEMLCTFEAALVDSGVIPCEWNLIAARKRGARIRAISRPLPRLDEELDPDPLRMRSRWRMPARRATRLEEWHVRLLRIVLHAATSPPSALHSPLWFEEQPMHSAMERFRFAVANTSAFDWITSRYRAYGDDPIILGLLATFDTLAPQ